MPSLDNIFPAANEASYGGSETTGFPGTPKENSESFDRVMSRALSPQRANASAAPNRQRTNSAGAQKKYSTDPHSAVASASAGDDSATGTTDSSAPVKTKTRVKSGDTDGKAEDVPVPTQSAATLDESQNTPIHVLAPTLAACLLKTFAPVALQSAANNPAVNAVLAAGVDGKNGVTPVVTVPVVDATAATAGADAVSQLASSGLPKPLAVKNLVAEKTTPEQSDAKTTGLSAVASQISELAGVADSAPKQVELVSADDSPSSDAGGAVALQNSAAQPAAFAPVKSHGTSVAKHDLPMKNAEQTNKVAGLAGPGEKVLPGEGFRPGAEINLSGRTSSIPVSARVEPPDANAIVVPAAQANPVRGTGPADDASAVANISDVRSQALDRTHDLVMLHALRLVGADSDSLQVVIKPDAGTQLSLELRQRGGGIEAQAVLQSGDFDKLKQHWPELQQRLEQRGIKLAPLASTENQTSWSGSQGFKQQPDQPAERGSFLTGAFAGFVPAGAIASSPVEPAIQAATSRGWQTWA